ncbi:acetylxylan esterase [Cellulomonas soli]|uniref:Acetylxylan esterase n=1 Tax=Cellulomonas soli TaxID=931535 RepID=A0A512PEP2_9CELL|nr:acetylxylan esterase [Cellulomonas soli]NYI58861.1 cephalosporin-C deacetylase [Cellulomonas soli]GEP69643.1 acetylxylan esterase [Cellulomonas soli]
MALTDMPLPELREYRPALEAPDGLVDFWTDTVAQSRAAQADGPTLVPARTPVTELVVEDLTFPGFAGDPIRAWVTRPRREGRLPVVVEYVGYGGGRGLPGERLQWALAGYVHVVMDTRGQGSGWGNGGDTPDPHGSGPSSSGFMTRGIEDPSTYYYRRLYTDAVRLLDAVRTLPFVDVDRIAVTGGSQGGGITLAAASISGMLDEPLAAAMPDVPYLCHFRRSAQATPLPPFTELRTYLSVHRDRIEDVFRTLALFDGAVLAPHAQAPAIFSVALMDDVVLPSTVFAAFNAYGSADRSIEVYEFNGHEGGQLHQWVRQADWLAERV